MESNLSDEIDCTALFDQMDDLIEFPPENDSGGLNFEAFCESKDVPSMWNGAIPEKLDRLLPVSSIGTRTSPSDLSAELSVPYEDIVQLEWLSTFVEESFCGIGESNTIGKEASSITTGPCHSHFQSPSPVSILDSCTSFSGEETTPPGTNHPGRQRARTKRPRPTASNARAATQLMISPASPFTGLPPVRKASNPKPELHSPSSAKPTDAAARKCLHCEITKTPQWRAGPMGPKTLCNACGVRHKSGRLFPEYHPAASPKFVPSLHSNSHKKVMELRCNIATTKTTTSPDCLP